MNNEKDYSLLRPFDLDAAKRGEAICANMGEPLVFVAEAGPDGDHCVRLGNWHVSAGNLATCESHHLRMAPLCWVEGKPVYKGDVLYSSFFKHHPCDVNNETGSFVVGGLNGDLLYKHCDIAFKTKPTSCTWNPPKVKRSGWVNIVEYHRSGEFGEIPDRIVRNADIFPTKEAAEKDGRQSRNFITCVRIEWEEPAK